MSDPQPSVKPPENLSREEEQSALFAQLVMQQANMAMMLLGKVPHPETGQPIKDIDGAKLFIDMLEVLEAKTKGNLTKEEAGLLKQSLMSLRLSFVEAVESPDQPAEARKAADSQPATPETSAPAPAPAAAQEESHKKFSKKY